MLCSRSDAHHASANDHTCLIPQAATIGGSFYVFGGMAEITEMTPIFTDMLTKYRLPITDTSEGCAVFHTSYRYDVSNNSWTQLPSPPFPVVAGGTVVLQERYIVLLGSEQRTTFRVGNTSKGVLPTALGEPPASALSRWAAPPHQWRWAADYWSGYGDQVLCYDTHTSKWSRIGVMPYGLGTLQSVTNGSHIYTFGGEPTTHHVRAAASFCAAASLA